MIILGKSLATLPECVVNALCVFVGALIAYFPSGRNRVAYSNLAHCFPQMSPRQIRHTAFESARRMVEMALFVMASPYMSDERLRAKIKLSDYVKEQFAKNDADPKPIVLLIPHFCMMETITMFPLLAGAKVPRTGVFYRPFDSPAMENRVRQSRERFGIELLNRKQGLGAAIKFLRENGCVALLFDQNAGTVGARSLFFGRVCSSSELGGILVEHSKAECDILYAKRTAFWQATIDGTRLDAKTREDVTIQSNDWLENYLKSDDQTRADWLWLHRRWYINRDPRTCLRIKGGKTILPYTLKKKAMNELPKSERIFLRAPDSPEEASELAKALPLLKNSRPDAAITIIADSIAAKKIAETNLSDKIITAPKRKFGLPRAGFFVRLRDVYPDIYLDLSAEGIVSDIETRIVGAQMRLSLKVNGRGGKFAKIAMDLKSAPKTQKDFEEIFKFFGAREGLCEVLREDF